MEFPPEISCGTLTGFHGGVSVARQKVLGEMSPVQPSRHLYPDPGPYSGCTGVKGGWEVRYRTDRKAMGEIAKSTLGLLVGAATDER